MFDIFFRETYILKSYKLSEPTSTSVMNHEVERGTTSDAFLGVAKNERCGKLKESIISLINFSF